MRRLPFLSAPGAWVRSSSRLTDSARDAYAIERYQPKTDPLLSVLLATVIGVLFAAVLVHWLAGA